MSQPIPELLALSNLDRLSLTDFIAGWRAITGEPPAIILESRSEMIRLLIDSTPVAPGWLDSCSTRQVRSGPSPASK